MGPKQHERFRELENRNIWDEQSFAINPQGENKEISMHFENMHWGVVINPPKNLNYDMVHEFYANALSSEGDPFTFAIMIRGRTIHFNREEINKYMGNPLVLSEYEPCHYSQSFNKVPNVTEISARIFLRGQSCRYLDFMITKPGTVLLKRINRRVTTIFYWISSMGEEKENSR